MFQEKSSTHVFALRAILAAVMIILAAVLRIVPHPWNFTPIGAMALFSGAIFRDRRVGGAVFLGALQFFLVTNFAVWQLFGTYPHTPTGLAACYIAGLPFFGNAIAGDALYATLFFGTFALAEKFFPTFRLQQEHSTFNQSQARP